MATLRETVFEVDALQKKASIYQIFPGRNTKNMSITVSFVLQQKIRLILANSGDQVVHDFEQLPYTVSPRVKWDPQKGLSQADIRNKLYQLGVTKREYQNILLKKVETYVDRMVKHHLSLSNHPNWHKRGLKVELFARIFRVSVYQDRLNDRATKPADESEIRKLKRKRVEEKMVGEEEKCTVCLETLVEKEQLIVLPCEHVFHEDCGTTWLKNSNLCPLCRFKLPAAHKQKA